MFRMVKSEEIEKQAIKLYIERKIRQAVIQILGIEKNMCLRWIRKYAKNIEPKETPNARVNVIKMDWLHDFIEKKTEFTR